MAAIHDEFNTWKGAEKRSRSDVTQWLNDKGVSDHGKFKTAARQAKVRSSQTGEQKASANAARRAAEEARIAEQHQTSLDNSHHELGQALQSTDQPVKVEFTTDRSGTGKWADRMVPAHAVPTFAQGSESQNMVVTVFHGGGQSTAFHLSRPKTTAPLNTRGHSTGGRAIQKVVRSPASDLGAPPFTGTMNEGDRQTLEHQRNALQSLESSPPQDVEVPSEMRQMGDTMRFLEGVHRENLGVIHRTDEQPDRSTHVVVSARDLSSAYRTLRSTHRELAETDPQYAAAADRAVTAHASTEAHAKEVAKRRRIVQNLSRRGSAPTPGVEHSDTAAMDTMASTGIAEQEGGYSVASDNRDETRLNNYIDSDQMIDYVRQESDTPGMRQGRSAMHLARAAGAASDADAAAHARRAEAAAGVQWGAPPSSAELNPMSQTFAENGGDIPSGPGVHGSGMRIAPTQIDLSGSGDDGFAKAQMAARIAGQMRSNPLYAGAVGTGLAKTVKAMGGKTAPTSSVKKIASEAKGVAQSVDVAGPVIGYPHAEYRRGITATSRDPMPPYHGLELTDERPDETGPIADVRNEVRAGLSTLIGHRNTRASRGR